MNTLFLRHVENHRKRVCYFCIFYMSLVAKAFKSELPRVPAKYS